MCTECNYAPECYACMVGVATGPESHAPCCSVRGIPMPVQDGSFGPEWDKWERAVVLLRLMTAAADVQRARPRKPC